MKKILIGTTNPSKVKRFETLLSEYDLEFCTLKDLDIKEEPDETGTTPAENAAIKAKFYGQYNDFVICNDSGLYFSDLDLSDKRQPGLKVRSPQGMRLNDKEMIAYYLNLVKNLGGKIKAYYLDGFAVCNRDKIMSFMDVEASKKNSFYMVTELSEKRREGWPLDSMSQTADQQYFTDISNEVIIIDEYENRLKEFLEDALEIK